MKKPRRAKDPRRRGRAGGTPIRRRWRLRSDLVSGAHPDDPERVLVLCPRTKRRAELTRASWKLLRSLDGSRTIASIVRGSMETIDEDGLLEIVEELQALGFFEEGDGPATSRPARPIPAPASQWFVAERPELAPIAVHPGARFGCRGAGTCCESGFVIALTSREVRSVRGAARRLFPESSQDPVCLMPTGRGRPWTYALAHEPHCAFFTERRQCLVHGTAAQPSPCRVFPYRFVAGPEQIHASVSHRCVCGALDAGDLLSQQTPEIARRLSSSRFLHAIPDVTRIDDLHRAESDAAVDVLVLAADAEDPFEILIEAVTSLGELCQPRLDETPSSALGPGRILEVLLRALGQREGEPPRTTAARALMGAPHLRRRVIREDLEMAGLYAPRADARLETGRFVRDFVFGLQLYHYPTLSSGLLAAGLASARILHDLPKAAHPIARERIMLWENVLMSTVLPALLGPRGPLASIAGSLSRVEHELDALSRFSRARGGV